MSYKPYHSKRIFGKFDAIIIGSGIGGLAAGALLAKANKRVLVLERHYVPGGFTHTFKRKGYEWDVGLHYIGEVHQKRSLLKLIFDDISNGQLKWEKMPSVYDKIIFPDHSYDFVSGLRNFRDRMCLYFPKESRGIDFYMKDVEQLANAAKGFFGQKIMPPWLAKLSSPFMQKPFYKYSNQTTLQVLSQYISDPKLIGVLTAQFGDYGLTPAKSSFAIHALVAKHYFEGACYPVGGSAQIANTIIPVIEDAGGKVLVKADVQNILIKNGKACGVKLAQGDEIYADTIISDAGVINTFQKFIPDNSPEKNSLVTQLKTVSPSLAHICLYIGLKETAESLKLPKSNLWIYPDYNHDQNFLNYQNNVDATPPVIYISFPSAKDPEWTSKHPGTATIEVIGVAPYNWFEKWKNTSWMKRGDDYLSFKQSLADKLLENLYKHVPQVKDKIDHCEISTPLSTQHFCNYDHGEIYGIDHTPQRFQQQWLKPVTPIKNLYLTGQDIVSDGIGGALFGGVLCSIAVLKRNVIKDILRRTR